MKLKVWMCTGLLASAAWAAHAEDLNQSVTPVANADMAGSYSAGWSATHVEAGSFTDTFSFAGLSGGVFTSLLSSIGAMPSEDINFTSVSINGQAFQLNSLGLVDLARITLQPVTGPLVLMVMGTAGPGLADGSALSASYAGTANIAAVPEPGTIAMMLAGLGVMGTIYRRRKDR